MAPGLADKLKLLDVCDVIDWKVVRAQFQTLPRREQERERERARTPTGVNCHPRLDLREQEVWLKGAEVQCIWWATSEAWENQAAYNAPDAKSIFLFRSRTSRNVKVLVYSGKQKRGANSSLQTCFC